MTRFINFLSGKKTYIVASAAIIGTIFGYLTGSLPLDEALKNVFAAVLSMTLRSGISSNK